MQVKKIVSGGQTGADRAALDFAIEYGIDHGGWVPEGRLAEDGAIPERYRLRELAGGGYAARTEKNVTDADGTLIVSRGELTGGSLLTRQMAEKHARPCLHVHMGRIPLFESAIDVYEWIVAHGIGVLNVAGPRASKDPFVYEMTRNLLEMVWHIDAVAGVVPGEKGDAVGPGLWSASSQSRPRSVDEAVAVLVGQLDAKLKSRIASRRGTQLPGLQDVLDEHIIGRFGLFTGNAALLESCRKAAGSAGMDQRSAALFILRKLWERLRETGQLRVVK